MSYPFVNKSGNRSLNVMLGDISYFNRQRVHAQYVPLAIGMIAQYAKQEFGNDINLSLFKSIDKFLEKTSENPRKCTFSEKKNSVNFSKKKF